MLQMNYQIDLQNKIAYFLYKHPSNIIELRDRDFLKNTSCIMLDRILSSMESIDMIYFRNAKYYTYEKYAITKLSEFIE